VRLLHPPLYNRLYIPYSTVYTALGETRAVAILRDGTRREDTLQDSPETKNPVTNTLAALYHLLNHARDGEGTTHLQELLTARRIALQKQEA
jgi:hypothetical protein